MDWSVVIGFVVGIIVPLIFTNYLPNEKFYNWGVKVGALGSKKGQGLLGEHWDKIENNFTGSFIAFANGLKEGADSDDE